MRTPLALTALFAALTAGAARADDLPVVKKVERQPLAAQAVRVAEALHLAGSPLSAADRKTIDEAKTDKDQARAVAAIQEVFDRRCLAAVTVRADKTDKKGVAIDVKRGPAAAE